MNQPEPTAPDVVTLGEAMMVFNGPTTRPLERGASAEATFAGAEMNLSIGLARLGYRVRWLSALGDDLFGREILKTARGEGVDISSVPLMESAPTGVLFKSARGWGEPEVLYYRAGSACSRLSPGSFAPRDWRGARYLFLSGITPALSTGCRELVFEIAAAAKKEGMQIWLDPNYRRKLWTLEEFRATLLDLLPLVDVVLPGAEEGHILTGETEPSAVAKALMAHGAGAVALKCGAAGAHWFDASGSCFQPPFELSGNLYPIGAGDAFAAGLLSGHLDALPPLQALERAHALGALACYQMGDWEGAPTRRELALFLSRQTGALR